MRNRVMSLMARDFRVMRSERAFALSFFGLLTFSVLLASFSPLFSGLLITVVLVTTYTLNTFSLDEKYHTERFTASLPVRRRDIVLARYAAGLILTAFVLALASAANALLTILGHPASRPIPFGYMAVLVAIICGFCAVSLPFCFRLGYSKARAVMKVFYLGLFIATGILVGLNASTVTLTSLTAMLSFPAAHFLVPPVTCAILLAAAMGAWMLSFLTSARMYERRDL
jgi:ABC-type transport system involved in multi-copper enzyme maturation permease subunit